jgi:hypothetical protein
LLFFVLPTLAYTITQLGKNEVQVISNYNQSKRK